MDAQILLLEALDSRWLKYRDEVKKCRQEFSEEAVHDLRVATRRLLALVELIRAVAPQPRLKKIRAVLKDQLDNLNDLRDTQVMLAESAEMLDTLPQIRPFQQHLKRRERRLMRQADELVNALKLGGVSKRLGKIHADLAEPNVSLDFSAGALAAADEAYLTVTQRYGAIDPLRPATIHRVRVAFKKFRYMLEVLHPLLPDFPENQLKRMHDYQTAMGAIQDVEVFLRALADFAAGEDAYDPEPVRRYYEQRHAELIAAYIEDKGELFAFWRPQPNQPFAWEIQNEPVHRPTRQRRRAGNPRLRTGPPASTHRKGT